METYANKLDPNKVQIKGFKVQFLALKTNGRNPRLLSISVDEGEFLALFTDESKIGAGEKKYEVVSLTGEEIIYHLRKSSDEEGVIINYGNERIILKTREIIEAEKI